MLGKMDQALNKARELAATETPLKILESGCNRLVVIAKLVDDETEKCEEKLAKMSNEVLIKTNEAARRSTWATPGMPFKTVMDLRKRCHEEPSVATSVPNGKQHPHRGNIFFSGSAQE
jgi:hypothetical protein